MSLTIVVEGDTDLPVVHKLAEDARLEVLATHDMGGKGRLDERLDGFNQAAIASPWFVLRDLDHDAQCAPDYLAELSFEPSRWMAFRIAVRELEAWLLADHDALARFLKVSPAIVPPKPDAEEDPTQTIVNLARRSTSARVKAALVPKQGAAVSVGPEFEGYMIEFGARHWRLERACKRSESLRRTREALRELGRAWNRHVGA